MNDQTAKVRGLVGIDDFEYIVVSGRFGYVVLIVNVHSNTIEVAVNSGPVQWSAVYKAQPAIDILVALTSQTGVRVWRYTAHESVLLLKRLKGKL